MSSHTTPQLITDNLDLWTTAIKKRSATGRGSNKKIELTGIKKLRELILELAVHGKLVPQDPNDEPASVLLKKIAAEKAQLIKDKKIKKPKVLPEIREDEKSFELPSGWEWLRLTEAYYSISPSGSKLKGSEIKEQGTHPVIDQGQKFIAGYTELKDLLIQIPQPVIVFSDHTTNIKYIDFNFVAGADGTKILSPLQIYPRYLYRYLLNYDLENRGYARHFKILNDNLMAIPPLAEQHRIVAKVDELMALCDQLEQQTEDSITAHQTLVETLLATLSNSETPAAFKQNWARIAEHFDTLFTTEHSIDQLKQTLLQLAVMGKLLPQNPNDEPASVLLEKIATEKEQLIKDKKIKKQKPLPAITEDEKPFELPCGWEWSNLQNLITIMDAGWSPACPPEPSPSNEKWGILKTTSVQSMEYREYENKVLADSKEPKPQYEVKKGDILITRAGPKNRVGVSCLVQGTRPKLMISDKIIRFHLVEAGMCERFISLCLNAGVTAKYLETVKSGMAESQMNISQNKLKLAPIPLCSANEQHRIVKKVDELMALCDQLKTRLSDSQATQLHLADTIVEQAVS